MDDAVERAQTHAVFADYVRREFRTHADKLDAAREVEALLASPGWGILERLVGRKVDGLMAGMDAEVQAHAEYVATHSQRYGMRSVLDLPQTIRNIAAESVSNEQAQAGQGE